MMEMMTMTTERRTSRNDHPTVEVPPWPLLDDPTLRMSLPLSGISSPAAGDCSPFLAGEAALAAALQRYLPSNNGSALAALAAAMDADEFDDDGAEDDDLPVDAFSSDEFRMYEFKIRRCSRARSHDWTECPFAHPGEKARRRDPRKYHYSGAACPDFRKGSCKRGDACEYAHGVFECWLHPARYRTQPCKDGTACRRRVCFFAHTPDQLRILPQQQQQYSPKSGPNSAAVFDSYDGSPLRQQGMESYFRKNIFASPPISPPSESPPMSPNGAMFQRASWPVRSSANEVLESLRKLQLGTAPSSSWGAQMGNGLLFGSPRGSPSGYTSGFFSLPSTPTRAAASGGAGGGWREGLEGPLERVESGRALRVRMFERLSKDGFSEKPAAEASTGAAPDVEWVSELVM